MQESRRSGKVFASRILGKCKLAMAGDRRGHIVEGRRVTPVNDSADVNVNVTGSVGYRVSVACRPSELYASVCPSASPTFG